MTNHQTSSSPNTPFEDGGQANQDTSPRIISFANLGVFPAILRVLTAIGYKTPTPIQTQAIPELLDGEDVLGIAQTGTGKTAAFAIPILQLISERGEKPRPGHPTALILAPTRELAIQIEDSFLKYGRGLQASTLIVCGGVNQRPQVQSLQGAVNILIATPGRLLDLMNQGHCRLTDLSFLAIDEADRMLDMGFLPDVRRIIRKAPRERQTLLFSATMPDDITELAKKILHRPVRIEVTPQATTAENVIQSVFHVRKSKKREALVRLLNDPDFKRTLVFVRTKHGADYLIEHLRKEKVAAHAIHGNKTQRSRELALREFRDGNVNILVATDIAARGLDIAEITHVINYDLPNIAENYVHRIGRTARACRSGISISFCDEFESEHLRAIQNLLGRKIPTMRSQDLKNNKADDESDQSKRATKLPVPFERVHVIEEENEARARKRPRRPIGRTNRAQPTAGGHRRRGETRPGSRRAKGTKPTKRYD